MEQEERLCHEMEIVGGFTYIGGRVSVDGRCQAVVTSRT